MDGFLALIEPQIAIPVVGVVVCAILVYIFGFQKTQEPSFQHLAVLQSSGKSKHSNGVTHHKPRNQPAPSPRNTSAKAKEKAVSNGSIVQGSAAAGKENAKPQQQQPTTPKSKKEKAVKPVEPVVDEGGDGDWIQAVSRKDKKTRVKKDDPKPAAAASASEDKAKFSPPPAGKPRPILEEIALRAKMQEETKKEEEPKEIIKDIKAAGDAKKIENKKVVDNKSAAKKENKEPKVREAAAPVEEKEKPKEVVEKPVEANANSKVAEPPKVAATPEPKSNAKEAKEKEEDPKSNIAFDEVGDLWEEAKSRGAKKKRVRKD